MIHHLSIPAVNPFNVAKVIGELFESKYIAPFPSHPGSYVALAGDEYGTVIEVYPRGTEMIPGKEQQPIQYQNNDSSSPYSATHAAISIPITQEKIEEIAAREGWRVLRCSRGFFDVIEFWIENCLLLELVTPELTLHYTNALAPEKLAELFEKNNPSRTAQKAD